MTKNINFKRLSLAIQEFWLLNKGKLVSIPLVVFVLLMLIYFWYDTPLFNHFILRIYPSNDVFVSELANYRGFGVRILAFFAVAVYIIICTQPYLGKMSKSVRITLVPFTRGERLITLWIFMFGIIGAVFASFAIVDHITVYLLKSNYLADALLFKESEGELYYTFDSTSSYFHSLESKFYLVIFFVALFLTPIYHLAVVFFKKYSIVLSSLMLAIIVAVLVNIGDKMHGDNVYITSIDSIVTKTVGVLFAVLVTSLIITTTYFKLKEKEI